MNSEVKFTFSQTRVSEENLAQALLATLKTRNAHISTQVLCPPTVPGQAGEEPGVLRHWAGTSYLSDEAQLQFFLWRQNVLFPATPNQEMETFQVWAVIRLQVKSDKKKQRLTETHRDVI